MKQQSENPLWQSASFSIYRNRVVQGRFIAEAISNRQIRTNYQGSSENPNESDHYKEWSLQTEIGDYPSLTSDHTLLNAIYNLSLEELKLNIEVDGTFRTGAEWPGVWTRDVSYSILLSIGLLEPAVSQESLKRKVRNGVIVQDTGTGGAYPVSTDRVIWGVAAWEIFLITGDHDWLKYSFHVLKSTLEDDLMNIYDPVTGLVKGESSFLDWREQTYPAWMEPVDIAQSACLGTNAVHFQACVVLSQMAGILEEDSTAAKFKNIAQSIRNAMNQYLWVSEKNYFGQFLYGKDFSRLSPRSETLGEALCILFDIADPVQQQSIVENLPINPFGAPCIFPQIPAIPPYHNKGMWPFVQAFWSLASARTNHHASLEQSLFSMLRATGLFLTNKENLVVEDGDYQGTQINSDRQLWSVAGSLSLIYQVLFGIKCQVDRLDFEPFIPESLEGTYRLSDFRYRNAILDITVKGVGNQIQSFEVNGQLTGDNSIPGNTEGKQTIEIVLSSKEAKTRPFNLVEPAESLAAPFLTMEGSILKWEAVSGVDYYQMIKNGEVFYLTKDLFYDAATSGFGEYQVEAVDKSQMVSFSSQPVYFLSSQAVQEVELGSVVSEGEGASNGGYLEIGVDNNTMVHIPLTINEGGRYAVSFLYANGNGPVNTNNKAAIRTLRHHGQLLGTMVFPQRGYGEWDNWGYSNSVLIDFTSGEHRLQLSYEPQNKNMDGGINQAFLKNMIVRKVD